MYEVELKAWIDEPEVMRARLDELCSFRREYDKRDRYFAAPRCAADPGWLPQQFRLRRDDERLVCTFKQKGVEEGVEVNLEREFDVSDEESFVGLIRRLGCTPLVDKHKQGRQYEYRGLTVELSWVHSLGTFLEIEKLVPDDAGDAERDAAGAEVRDALASLGVDPDRIEERPYTRMLLDGVRRR
jgi:adenylate cyclase class 2